MTLSELGVSPLAATIHAALLSTATLSAEELPTRVEASAAELQAALEQLIRANLIREVPAAGGSVLYEAERPSLVVNRLIERREDEIVAQLRRVSAIRSQVGLMDTEYVQARSGPEPHHRSIERVTGIELIRERIDELTFFTRLSVRSIQPGGPQSPAALEASRPLDRRLARRQVSIQLIHEGSVLDDELNRIYLHELLDLGAQVRVTGQPADRLLIFDDQVAVVPVDPGNSKAGALIVREPALVIGLVGLFDRVWQAAAPLHWQVGGPVDEPGEQITTEQRDVLAMLAAGSTDETIARSMGISVRHLRRTISRLMIELHAHSRFEAGAKASERGWLIPAQGDGTPSERSTATS